MILELKKELIELILLFFLIFYGLAWIDIGNREAIHEQAVYESRFTYDFEVSEGWLNAAVPPEGKYKRKYRKKVKLVRD